MTTYKLHFNIRHFIHYCLFLLMSIAVCLSVYTVIDQETNLISYALKEKLQLNLFFRVINNYMVPKIISAVILFLLALFLMIMYYFSYFDLAYMRLTLLCLLGICYNFWIVEVETIFHGGQVMTQLWNKCSLIFACLMILFLISYIYESYFLRLPLILRTSLIFIAAAAILSMTVQSYSDAIKTAGLLYIYFSAILFLTQAALLFLKHYGNFFALLLPWSAAAGIIFLNDLYRTRNLSAAQIQSYTTLYNLSMLIVPAVIIYLTLMTVFHRQNTFFHDRETNRKIQEIDKTKHVLQKYIETSIIPHTKALTRLTDALTEHPYFDPQLLPEIRDMEREVRQIHLTAKKVGAYSIFQGEMIEMTLKLVNLNTIIGRAVNALQKDSILTDNDSTIIQEHIGYVNAPPGKLTQVIKDLFMALREMNDWGFINIHCFSAKNQVHIHLFLDEAPILSDKTRDHLKFPQKRPAYSLKKQQSFEYTLSVCQYILQSCGGRLKIASAKGIHIQLSLPLISQKPPEFEQKTTLHPDTDVALTDKILLISSDSEQQTQLFDLLKDGIYNYTLTQANDGVYYTVNPEELGRYSLLILGDLYYETNCEELINNIRIHYSMSQLPILLILPDMFSETETTLRSTLNDYLTAPYSPDQLIKKVKSLLALKHATDASIQAQMEFWQAQMNPHFIFNSMNSIMQMCINQPMEAYELLGSFSEYLRGHLFNLSLDNISTLEKEMDLITAYLSIEKARFGDHIQYTLENDGDADFPILPLLIEPLVENSIKHGSKQTKKVHVLVKIDQQADVLTVTVADNGSGMDQAMIRQILNQSASSRSIGLNNLCSRLKYYYNTVPLIESAPGQGTKISFSISRTHILQQEAAL